MSALEDIIQRCHKRHGETLRQRKTIVTPALHRRIPYDFKVHCARRTPIMLDDLEQANISFMPIGHAPENDRGPKDFGGERFLKRQGTSDWRHTRWFASWGIQIYTGIPSEREGACWHDLDFKYEAICAAPETVYACIEALLKTTGKPLLTLTKSGGLRFSCRIPNYLHSKIAPSKLYTYKHAPTPEDPHHRDVYLEIRGENGYSRWDTRYEILLGNLLDPPVIAKELLFATIDAFRDTLHAPDPSGERELETAVAAPVSLGSEHLDLAKAAFLKRGFSYVREDVGFHHWIRHDAAGEVDVSIWEDRGVVWVRASIPNAEMPAGATPLTEIWDDTGITPPTSVIELPVTDEIVAVREGKLSPLAIKRPPPTVYPQGPPKQVYGTLEESAAQIQRVFDGNARVISVISETAQENIESYLLEGGEICLNVPNHSFAAATAQRYAARKLPSFDRWRTRLDRWEQVKAVPIDVRMANPFQAGNPCEDPERCLALDEKGGHSEESICPKCPVYTECQARGYLSQPLALLSVKAQILPIHQLFIDRQHASVLEETLEPVDSTERICIIDDQTVDVDHLFLRCQLSKAVLEAWVVNWRGNTLGNFAETLLNALAAQGEPNRNPIGRVRAAVAAFQHHADVLTQQMCYINVRGKVVAIRTIDAETGKELARRTITFENGVSAHIPVDANAEDRLRGMGLPCLQFDVTPLIREAGGSTEETPQHVTPVIREAGGLSTEDIEVPMQMTEAIALGILDAGTVESIQAFPTVCKDPNWTYWHQLQRFFAHYTGDADAPMRWRDKTLWFRVPPVLHPSVKRLLLMSPMFTEQHLRRIFPSEKIEVVRTEPIAWIPGNRVFQLRTGIYSLHTILNYDSNWDVLGLSKIGERFLLDIRTEIDRDPRVKHAIITNKAITRELTNLSEKENVCFTANFKALNTVDFEAVEVLWIVGTPHWAPDTIWEQAQMLFGNDAERLYYDGAEKAGHYKDERLQGVYHQKVTRLLTKIVGMAGLNRWAGKKVVLLTGVSLPDITDRPETLLFDWEDFEVAGGLEKLPEVIATRERFETEQDNLTAESSRAEVERILGCSTREANRVLQRLRGGNIPRVSFQDQILALLADGEKKASAIVAAIGSSSQSVGNELKRLVDTGEIVKVRRGVYALPSSSVKD